MKKLSVLTLIPFLLLSSCAVQYGKKVDTASLEKIQLDQAAVDEGELVQAAMPKGPRSPNTRAVTGVFRQSQSKIGLALSGGGAKGSFEAGALARLYESGKRPSFISATSVGAINGSKLAEGGDDAMAELSCLWFGLNEPKDMWVIQPVMERAQEKVENIINHAEGANDIFNWVYHVPMLIKDLIQSKDIPEKAADQVSVYSIRPTYDLVRNNLSIEKVQNSGIDLRLYVVDLESGELGYVTNDGTLHLGDKTYDGINLYSAVFASASIPVFFEPVDLNLPSHSLFVDGGVREIVPVSSLTELQGMNEAYIILASPQSSAKDYTCRFGSRTCRLTHIGTRSLDLMTNEIAVNDIELGLRDIEESNAMNSPIVRVIEPHFLVHSGMEINPKLIRLNYMYGWMLMSDALSNTSEEQKAVLSQQSHAIAKELLDLRATEDLRMSVDFTSQAKFEKFKTDRIKKHLATLSTLIGTRIASGGEVPHFLLQTYRAATYNPNATVNDTLMAAYPRCPTVSHQEPGVECPTSRPHCCAPLRSGRCKAENQCISATQSCK